MTHDLTIVSADKDSKLLRGICSCSWESVPYGMRLSVRRAHDIHLDTVGMSDPNLHEARVQSFLQASVFGKRSKADG